MVEITGLLQSEEEVFFDLDNVTLNIASHNIGSGHLYVTNKNVHWISNNGERNYILNFYLIGLNAIFNKNDDFPTCVYCQYDQVINPVIENGNGSSANTAENEEEEEDGDEAYSEIRFIPADESKIHPIYEAFCQGALLNPDEDEDGEGDFYFNENEEGDEQELAFDPNDLNNDSRFEDADE